MTELRYPGEDWLIERTVRDRSQVPVDFSNLPEVVVMAKDSRNQRTPTLTKTAGQVVQGSATNSIRFELDASITSQLGGDFVIIEIQYTGINSAYQDNRFESIVQFQINLGQRI